MGRKWTQDEEWKLQRLLDTGESVEAISGHLRRTEEAIRRRIYKLRKSGHIAESPCPRTVDLFPDGKLPIAEVRQMPRLHQAAPSVPAKALEKLAAIAMRLGITQLEKIAAAAEANFND